MRKIVFVDIDGTIIDCNRNLHHPTNKTKEAFKRLKDNGHLVFIASGRAKCLLPQDVIDLNPSGFLLANGAYASIDDRILFQDTMSVEVKNEIIEFSKRNEACYYLETAKEIYTNDLNNPLHIEFTNTWDVVDCYTDKNYHDGLDINIGMLAIKKDDNLVKEVYNKLSPYVMINRHRDMYSFDLNIKGISKASGILKIINLLNIDIADTFAFGDGLNDIEMLELVSNGIAMANACNELKEVASDITLDVLDDGVYYGLEKYKLI